ncbi:MAG: CBS domain-containing protein [Myxococcota bacterium]|nr:CBS domain-containing protein [Myxococcota bacterium]
MSDDLGDDPYFEHPRERRGFDAGLIQESLSEIPVREALVLSTGATVTDAMRAMQREHRGCVLVTDDGTRNSKLVGIFTERDVLNRIVDRGKNPATLPLGEVMTPDPDVLSVHSTVAYALNKMSVGGFRHVPVVDDEHRPALVVSVRDIVEYLVAAFPREVLNLPYQTGSTRTREGA